MYQIIKKPAVESLVKTFISISNVDHLYLKGCITYIEGFAAPYIYFYKTTRNVKKKELVTLRLTGAAVNDTSFVFFNEY